MKRAVAVDDLWIRGFSDASRRIFRTARFHIRDSKCTGGCWQSNRTTREDRWLRDDSAMVVNCWSSPATKTRSVDAVEAVVRLTENAAWINLSSIKATHRCFEYYWPDYHDHRDDCDCFHWENDESNAWSRNWSIRGRCYWSSTMLMGRRRCLGRSWDGESSSWNHYPS